MNNKDLILNVQMSKERQEEIRRCLEYGISCSYGICSECEISSKSSGEDNESKYWEEPNGI